MLRATVCSFSIFRFIAVEVVNVLLMAKAFITDAVTIDLSFFIPAAIVDAVSEIVGSIFVLNDARIGVVRIKTVRLRANLATAVPANFRVVNTVDPNAFPVKNPIVLIDLIATNSVLIVALLLDIIVASDVII